MNNEHELTESVEVPPDPSVSELRKGTAQIQESDERGLDQTTRQKLAQALATPPPSCSYCIECLSAAQVARRCRCSKGAVIRRLNLIRKKTGLSPGLLRNLGPEPSINDLIPDPRSKVRRNNLLYADSTQDSFAE